MYPHLPLTYHFQTVPGNSLGAASSLLNPCCFQGLCLALRDASSHLLLHSRPVLAEGNQNEVQLSRAISLMRGCGERAVVQTGCCVAGEENQSEKHVHQRDSSQGPLTILYRVCLGKIRRNFVRKVALRSGHSSHQ